MYSSSRTIIRWCTGISLCLFTGIACSKGGDTSGTPAPCINNAINVTAVSTTTDPCNAAGTVTISATGGSGFTYSLDNVNFQSSAVFEKVAVGNYTVTAKENTGCIKTTTVAVASVAAGPLFQTVRTLVTANCAISGCHAGAQAPNFTVDCNIINNKTLIKLRAIDGIPSFMPPTGQLSATDKNKITAWIDGGGRFTD